MMMSKKKLNTKLLLGLLKILKINVACGKELTYQQKNNVKTITIPVDISLILSKDNFNQRIVNYITHEIGHYLVVPKGRRKLKDYGIPDKKFNATYTKYDDEEHKAILVGHYLDGLIGAKKSKVFGSEKFLKTAKNNYKWFNEHGKSQVDLLVSLV